MKIIYMVTLKGNYTMIDCIRYDDNIHGHIILLYTTISLHSIYDYIHGHSEPLYTTIVCTVYTIIYLVTLNRGILPLSAQHIRLYTWSH